MSTLRLNLFLNPSDRDRIVSFVASVFFHGCLLMVGGMLLVKPIEFGVERGASGVEIHLVAAPTPIPEQVVQKPKVVPKDPDPIIIPVEKTQPVTQPLPKPVVETSGQDQTTFHATGGALVEAKPDYLTNPAPRYPLKACQNGWQGTVFLKAFVDGKGQPIQVEIERSSGYDILDQAALKAVKGWHFSPAKLGTLAVESNVRIPIRFDLKDAL